MNELSFWEVPDWGRESSLNPNFVMAVIILLFVVIGIGIYSMAYRKIVPLKEQEKTLKSALKDEKAFVDGIKKLEALETTWSEKLELLEDHRVPLYWSRQLQAYQDVIANDISEVLMVSDMAFNKRVKMVAPQEGNKRGGKKRGGGQKSQKERVVKYKVDFTCEGLPGGDANTGVSQSISNSLSQALSRHEFISPYLQEFSGTVVTSKKGAGAWNGREVLSFQLNLLYNAEIDQQQGAESTDESE
jgi:hypothetical protein